MSGSSWIYRSILIFLTFCSSGSLSNAQDNETNGDDTETSPCLCGIGRRGKIVGGEEATPNEFPWIVGLTFKGFFGCGGSVINEKYILTAGHCVNKVKAKDMRAIIGVHNMTKIPKENIYSIAKIIPHPKYSDALLLNDIAILELSGKVEFSTFIRPICLPSPEEKYKGRNVTVAGWGYTRENSFKISTFLRKVTVRVLGNPRCRKSYFKFIIPTHICAGHEKGGKDACQGDSGGPLMVKNGKRWHVAGIVSYGEGCARAEYPGLYTRVNKFLNWIRSTVGEVETCHL